MDAQAKADWCMAVLDGMADAWAEEINLTATIKNVTHPMTLSRNVPKEVKDKFRLRMEANIDAIARQCFIEGAMRVLDKLREERALAKRFGFEPN